MDKVKYIEQLDKCESIIRKHTNTVPETVIELGSGYGGLLGDDFIKEYSETYENLVDFVKKSYVDGHSKILSIGTLCGKKVLLLSGRIHMYEGYNEMETSFFIRIAKRLGAKNVLLTNASGGINKSFNPGDVMLIDDHITMFVRSPLMGENIEEFGPRFPDMGVVYDQELREIVLNVAKKNGIDIKRGSYAQLYGPQYETPAEVNVLKAIGADAVGMSTATEAIVARHAGMRVVGISCVTNVAGKQSNGAKLSQAEVERVAGENRDKLKKLIIESVKNF